MNEYSCSMNRKEHEADAKIVNLIWEIAKIVNPDTLSELSEVGENAIVLIAINVGSIRLIDNVFIKRTSRGIEIDHRFERYC